MVILKAKFSSIAGIFEIVVRVGQESQHEELELIFRRKISDLVPGMNLINVSV